MLLLSPPVEGGAVDADTAPPRPPGASEAHQGPGLRAFLQLPDLGRDQDGDAALVLAAVVTQQLDASGSTRCASPGNEILTDNLWPQAFEVRAYSECVSEATGRRCLGKLQ